MEMFACCEKLCPCVFARQGAKEDWDEGAETSWDEDMDEVMNELCKAGTTWREFDRPNELAQSTDRAIWLDWRSGTSTLAEWNAAFDAVITTNKLTHLKLRIFATLPHTEWPSFEILIASSSLVSLSIRVDAYGDSGSLPTALATALQSKSTWEDLELSCAQPVNTALGSGTFENLRTLRLFLSESSASMDCSLWKFPRLQAMALVNFNSEPLRMDLGHLKELKAVSIISEGNVSMDLGPAVASLQVVHPNFSKLEVAGDLSTVKHLLLSAGSGNDITALIGRCVSLKMLAVASVETESIAIPFGLECLVLVRTTVDELVFHPLHRRLRTLVLLDSVIRTPPPKLWATHLCLGYSRCSEALHFERTFAANPRVLGSPRSLVLLYDGPCDDAPEVRDADVAGELLKHQGIRSKLEFLATNIALKSPLPRMDHLSRLWLGSLDGFENVQKGKRLDELVLDCKNQKNLDQIKHLLPEICDSVVLDANLRLPTIEGLAVEYKSELDIAAGKIWSTYVRQPLLDDLFLSRSANGAILPQL